MTFEDFFNEYLALHTGGPYAVYEVSKLQEMHQKFAYVFEAGRKAGLEEAAEIACKTTAPVSIGRDKSRHHIAGAQHAAKIIRAKMEEEK